MRMGGFDGDPGVEPGVPSVHRPTPRPGRRFPTTGSPTSRTALDYLPKLAEHLQSRRAGSRVYPAGGRSGRRARSGDPLDRRRDRAELAVDGQRRDDDSATSRAVVAERREHDDAGEGADEVGARVAEHRLLAQRQHRADEQRADEDAEQLERVGVQAPRQRPASSRPNAFSTRPGRRSSRLKRFVVSSSSARSAR